MAFVMCPRVLCDSKGILLPDNCILEKKSTGHVTCQDMMPDFSPFDPLQLAKIRVLTLVNCGPSVLTNQSFVGLDQVNILIIKCKIMEFETGTFAPLSNLKHLEIEGDLTYIPNGVFCQSPSLNTLILGGNRLTAGATLGFDGTCSKGQIPSCVTNITSLSIANNAYTEITKDLLCSFPNLTSFNASRNVIIKIDPLAFSRVLNLNTLDLSNNSLASLNSHLFQNVTLLGNLDLSYNKFITIPSSIFKNMTSLYSLSLKGNQIMSINSHAFSYLTNLLSLDLSSNSLTKLDGVLSLLGKLTTLDLDNNKLSTITSSTLFGLLQLHHLNLDNNVLTTVDKDAFKYNPRLTVLSLNNNLLTALPSLAWSPRIFAIYISDNKLSSLSETAFQNCTDIFYLDLSNNQIESINNVTFQNLTFLMKLNLANNSLSVIANGSFDYLVSLKYLILKHNNLTFEENVYVDVVGSEHMDLLTPLKNLLFLNLSTNAISRFDYGWFPRRIVYLSLSNNSITTLPTYDRLLDPTPIMHILDLANNNITKILPSQFPPSLEKLLLQKNQIATVAANAFSEIPELEYLFLHNNLLTTLPQLDVGTNLPTLTLRNNPWLCDCKLSWLRDHDMRSFLIYDSLLMKCQYLFNKTLEEPVPFLTSDDHHFLCDFKQDPTNHTKCFGSPYKTICLYECPINCTCYHDIAWKFMKIDCSNAQLQSMPKSIPKITKSYYLDGNSIPYLDHTFLQDAMSLKSLFLNSSKIVRIANGTFSFGFNLETLHLNKNLLKTLPIEAFKNLSKLITLDLSFNQLENLDPRVFAPLTALQSLSLRNNMLTSFPVWSFAELPAVTSLGLANNPWDCSCEFTTKYRDWLQTHIGKLMNVSELVCTLKLPNGFTKNISLVFFNTTHCFNFPSNALLSTAPVNGSNATVVTVIVCLTVIIMAVGAAVFIYRRELKLSVERRFGVRLL